MKTLRLLPLLLVFVLSACGSSSSISIGFIGATKGTLQTPPDEYEFTDRFSVRDREILMVVSLTEPVEGARVQATWYRPDDRTDPVGRTTVLMQSGATAARFTLSSEENWEPSPYFLEVIAAKQNGDEIDGDVKYARIFIGMNDEDIQEYFKEYQAWKQQQEQ